MEREPRQHDFKGRLRIEVASSFRLFVGRKEATEDEEIGKSHQVDGNGSAQQESQIDVDGVVLVLNDPSQAANDGADDEGEDQQGLEQFGRVRQRAVEVHLKPRRKFEFGIHTHTQKLN